MENEFLPSEMWRSILPELQSDETGDIIERANRFFARWSPETNGVRFFKQALLQAAMALTADHGRVLDLIGDNRLRDAYEVRANGRSISFDYLQVAHEVVTLMPVLSAGARVVEIGAGYGRTCHGLLSACDTIASYTIIDLAECMEITRQYLAKTLPVECYGKVHFLAVQDLSNSPLPEADLYINIDSMAEMDVGVVTRYLQAIEQKSRYFFSKNPVGKYLPSTIGLQGADALPAVTAAMKTGPLRDVVDIFDNQAVEAKAEDFVAAYRPGPDWTVLSHGWAPPWSYYWQALYARKG